MMIAISSGTPIEFFKACRVFSSRSRVQVDDPVSLGEDWGLPPRIWHEDWSQCSGGESQRAMLAIAIALKPDILLLDEPTSYFILCSYADLVHWMKNRFYAWRKHYGIESYQHYGLPIPKNRNEE
jgi:ABC-type iron transport system FetAB ATPase subunit